MPRPISLAQVHRSNPARAEHSVRIIGGHWKRSKLPVLDKDGLRPTPDRVRETLFNWLGADLSGWHCLDAFAGSGALGLEAASRGAGQVLLVESDADLVRSLQRVQERLGAVQVQIQRGSALTVLAQARPSSLDLVFLDPPFAASQDALFKPALAAAARALVPGGWLYLEAPCRYEEADVVAQGLSLHRYLHAGAVHAHLFVRAADPVPVHPARP